MRNYLQKKVPSASAENIDHIISNLSDQNLINDERFISEWISSQINKGKGPFYIKQQLIRLGLNADIIKTALDQVDIRSQIVAAKKLIGKKSHLFNKLNKKQHIMKIKSYLYNKGYSSQVIVKTIDDLRL